MKPEDLPVDSVVVGPDHRGVIPDAVAMIAKSIKEIGLTHPIAVRRLNGGQPHLIAGRQRLEAHKKLKRTTIPAILFDDEDIQAKRREHHENLCRANLTPAEEALAHHELKQLHEAEHPETKATNKGGPGRAKQTRGQNGHESPADRYTADVARKTGKGERTVRREARRGEVLGGDILEKIKGTALDERDQLDALVDLSEMAADEGSALVEELAAAAATGKNVNAKVERDKLKRIHRERALAEKIETCSEALDQQLYGVLLADPPWSRETWSEAGKSRDPANHYPTQNEDYLETLTLPAAADCVLFLWSTQEHLAQAMRLIDAWGFEYKSGAVWVKPKVSTGYWFRTRHELLLVATRGAPVAPAPGTQIESVIEAPVGRHSEKPTKVHEMIERLWPETPKLEMFARQIRDGWNSWGAEV